MNGQASSGQMPTTTTRTATDGSSQSLQQHQQHQQHQQQQRPLSTRPLLSNDAIAGRMGQPPSLAGKQASPAVYVGATAAPVGSSQPVNPNPAALYQQQPALYPAAAAAV
ncbi:hypothetical protein BASA60_011465 [Batrachochytrium salamandrivorans]|nr:hypothetical protein BASA60_011465 [Batrachochytrium salamandrivorans]